MDDHRSAEAREHDAVASRRGRLALALFGAVFAVVAIYLYGWESDPASPWPDPGWTVKKADRGFFYVAGIAATAVLAYFVVRRRVDLKKPRARRWVIVGLIALMAGSSLYYFSAVHGLRNRNYSHRWDSFHYLLGPKYYDEMSYYDLYRCTAQAVPQINGKGKTKFLETYKKTTVDELRKGPDCEKQFSPERWAQFKADLAVWGEGNNYRKVGGMLHDLGYNGTPTHSVVAGFFANQFEVSTASLVRATLFDVGFICLAMSAAVWAFGWRMGLCFALFFFVDATDRFSVDGASFFRHFWSASLITGIACLKRRRHGAAGFFMTASTAMNVFPVVFVVGVGVKMLYDWAVEKRIPARLKRFIVGALVASAVFGGVGMTSDRGPGAYGEFFENMETHDVRGRFPGFGVGLKFNFVEYGRNRAKSGTNQKRKKASFAGNKNVYMGTAAVLLGLSLLITTKLEDERAAIFMGLMLMYCQLETTGYYFSVIALLVLLWAGRLARAGPAGMLTGLFAVNVYWMRSLHEDSLYYLFNVSITTGLLVYLVGCLFVLGHETGHLGQLAALLRAPSADDADPIPQDGDGGETKGASQGP